MQKLNRPLPDWYGKRIWLIGASSGIGAALATEALAAGAFVALSARRAEQLASIVAAHPKAVAVPFDVLDERAWESAHDHILGQFGAIDLVVFCAAEYRPERIWEVTSPGAARTLAVNLGSVYTGLALVLPPMLARGHGGIAIVASVAGYLGLPKASVYGPSKAALINLAEILYSDLHPRGLDVYLINPGFVRTQLTAQNNFHMPAMQTPEAAARAIRRGISAGRFEIHFPWRFTLLVKLARLLPYWLRFALIRQLART